MAGTQRTKQVVKRRPSDAEGWTAGRFEARETVRRLLKGLVQLSFTKPGWRVLVFPDVSDLFWVAA